MALLELIDSAHIKLPWTIKQTAIYLAHVVLSLSTRRCARAFHVNAADVKRYVERIEDARDDSMVDAKLERLEARVQEMLA
jgi:hypothetical protein